MPNPAATDGIKALFDHFPYTIHTFQYINENAKKDRTIVKVFDDRNAALSTSLDLNVKGYDVYFMANEGSGIVPVGKKICRCQEAVTYLSQCFIDTDNCPITTINTYLESIGLTPHLAVNTSPGRYHLYFHFDPVETTNANIFRWKAIQNILARLGDPAVSDPTKTFGTDKTMNDYAKILRVPGFRHITKNHTVSVTSESDHPTYTIDDLFRLTEAQHYLDYNKETHGSYNGASHVPDLDPTLPRIQSPDRFPAVQSLSMWLANETGKSEGEKFDIYNKFVIERLDNTDKTYAVGNTLTKKSLDLFDSANKKKTREEITKVEVLQQTLIHRDDKKPSAFVLPDSFYLSAPNGFGDIVKAVATNCKYPSMAITFGTFLTGLSILKSLKWRTPGGQAPALYLLIAAPTGSGKNAPFTMLKNTFSRQLGLRRLVIDKTRSDQGVANHMGRTGGVAIFMPDEIGGILAAIQNKKSAYYQTAIESLFKDLFSAGGVDDYSFGMVGNTGKKGGEKEIIVHYPSFSICGFLTTDEHREAFEKNSVTSGFLQRLLHIVTEDYYPTKNVKYNHQFVVDHPLFNEFKDFIAHNAVLQTATDAEGKETQVDPIQAAPITCPPKMSYSPEAWDRFNEFEDFYVAARGKASENRRTATLAGMYTRVAEQVERVATTLAVDEITLEVLEYAIKFVEHQHKALMANAESTFMRGKGAEAKELEDRLTDAIAEIGMDKEGGAVTQRDVWQSIRNSFKNRKEFDIAVEDAEKTGVIFVDKKSKKPSVILKLADILK